MSWSGATTLPVTPHVAGPNPAPMSLPAAAATRASQPCSEPSVSLCPVHYRRICPYTIAPSDAEVRWASRAVSADSSWTSCGFAVGRDAALSGAAERPLPSGELPTLALARPLSSLFRGSGPGAADESAAVAAAAASSAAAAAAAATAYCCCCCWWAGAACCHAAAAAVARAASPPVAAELPGCRCCC